MSKEGHEHEEVAEGSNRLGDGFGRRRKLMLAKVQKGSQKSAIKFAASKLFPAYMYLQSTGATAIHNIYELADCKTSSF